jgi:hypothetical protein
MKARPAFNPSRFEDALTEKHYDTSAKRNPSVVADRKNFVGLIRKKHKNNAAAQALADKLDRCRPNRRCKSGACPECAGAAQVLFAGLLRRFIKDEGNGSPIACVSMVPVNGSFPPNGLAAIQHHKNVRNWRDALRKADVLWFIGGIDYSFNEHAEGRYKSYWAEHGYAFTPSNNLANLKNLLRERFPSSDTTPRPIKIKQWDGDSKALRYALKPNMHRRIASDKAKRHDRKNGGNRRCRTTTKQRLTSKQRIRLALHLDNIGIAGRLFLRGAQFVNYGGNRPRLVKRVASHEARADAGADFSALSVRSGRRVPDREPSSRPIATPSHNILRDRVAKPMGAPLFRNPRQQTFSDGFKPIRLDLKKPAVGATYGDKAFRQVDEPILGSNKRFNSKK